MDNEQILIDLYKQQQYRESRSKLQKLFMIISAVGSAIATTVTIIYFTNWLYVIAFVCTLSCVVITALLARLKKIKLNTACLLTALFSGYVFIPAFWELTGITGSVPYVSLIILVGIIMLFSGKTLKWLLSGYLAVLAGLTVYSTFNNFPTAEDDIISLVYTVTAYTIAVVSIVLYMLYKQKEFDELNDKFLRSSFKDELTQVYNRKLLDLILEYQESLYKRDHTDYILVMFDVDEFKEMNDEHGHVFGDIILRSVAQCIHQTTRDSDFVVRYGGDEFLVIQSNASDSSIRTFISRIEKLIDTSCQLEIHLSLSYGFAARSECESPETVMKLADKRLYEKKVENKVGR